MKYILFIGLDVCMYPFLLALYCGKWAAAKLRIGGHDKWAC